MFNRPSRTGKLGCGTGGLAVRLGEDAVMTLRGLQEDGLPCTVLPELKPYIDSHSEVLAKHMAEGAGKFLIPKGNLLLLPAQRQSKLPWMSRQTVWNAQQSV